MAFMQKVSNMEDKKVSIIMPAYNVEKYIEDAIQSVLAQTYRNFELLIINDGSTDDTERICQQYSDTDSRIRMFSKPNGGLSSARNFGLDHMEGDYVIFLDSDDYIASDCLYRLVSMKECFSADISVVSFIRVNENKEPLCKRYKENSKIVSMTGVDYVRRIVGFLSIGSYAWGKLFNASDFDGVRFPVGRLWEDAMVIPYILYSKKVIIFCYAPLWYYRVREGSIMNSYSEKRIDEMDSYQQLIDFGEKENDRILVWGAKRWYVRSVKYYKKMCRKYNKKIPRNLIPYLQRTKKHKIDIIRGYFNYEIRAWALNNIGKFWNY